MHMMSFDSGASARTVIAALLFVLVSSGCSPPSERDSAASTREAADLIYAGGPIITINDASPQAEAVAVKAGRIIAVGTRDEVMRRQGERTQVVDLGGRNLLPGFIDGHGHVSMVGFQALSANLLPPPDGQNSSIADVQNTLRTFRQQSAIPAKFGILFGFGYDDAQLAEQRHPTRDELDDVASDIPILIVHQSGHLGAMNSLALEMVGFDASTKDPFGGVIRRRQGTQEPNGVVEELAFGSALMKIFPKLTPEQSMAMLQEGVKLELSYGYTTVQDGRATPGNVNTAIAAAEGGQLPVDVVSYPDVLQIGDAAFMTGPYYQRGYRNRFRIGGVKLTLDGSPQGKTAWLSRPYFKPPQGQKASYSGYGVVKDDVALESYSTAFRNGWQILTHANGDAAIDQLVRTLGEASRQVPGTDRRPVLIHGQTLREDQVDSLKELGVLPSLFPMHTFYWGDWHRTSVLGPERAENISPAGWLLERDMTFTSHHDAPVAFPDSIRILDSTVNRTTRTGYVLGPEHRVEPIVALKALTIWAAYQHFEETTKGSIEPGKLADFVVLSDNPLTIPKEKLYDIKVLETIKEGNSVYRRNDAARAASTVCAADRGCFERFVAFNMDRAPYGADFPHCHLPMEVSTP